MLVLTDVLENVPTTTAEALELFDSLPAVEPEFLFGTWHGAEVPTGHPLDGMLAASGWWGKHFTDGETVHPLLFPTADGAGLWPLNPAPAFAGLGVAGKLPGLKRRGIAGAINVFKPVLKAGGPKARVRTTRYRGVDTATMIYDQVPANDVFRSIDQRTVLGAMDLRGLRDPYFFILQRDNSLRLSQL